MTIEQAGRFGHDLDPAMGRAIEIAAGGPAYGENPQVGCLILDPVTGKSLAEGFHHGVGSPHAEVEALRALPDRGLARGAVAVVTLEPCNHQGRTGPCSTALIDAGIATVAFAVRDPNRLASGGAEALDAAGVRVIEGVLAGRVERQLRVWLAATRLRRPFVTAKWASALDGRVAAQDGSSRWITTVQSRDHAHRQRSQADAILVGIGTVIADDPALTARRPDGALYDHQPVPVVLGRRELPPDATILRSQSAPIQYRQHALHEALRDMFGRGIRHVIVEGGPTVLSAFIRERLVDEYTLYLAPKLLGGERLATTQIGVNTIADAQQMAIDVVERMGEDVYIQGTPRWGPHPRPVMEEV